MPKARVYELAKELGVDSKTVLTIRGLGWKCTALNLLEKGEIVGGASGCDLARIVEIFAGDHGCIA